MKDHRVNHIFSSPWVALCLIALVGAVIYGNIYRAPFVFDDMHQIEENVQIRDWIGCLSPKQLFSQRPLVDLTFAINYRFGGLNVFGYHLVNVLIHIMNGFLVYILSVTIFERLLVFPGNQRSSSNRPGSNDRGGGLQVEPEHNGHDTGPRGSELKTETARSTNDNQPSTVFLMALFAALIFVAHPLQTQAVTYTAQRYASLAAMFYFLSILFYMKARIWQLRERGEKGVHTLPGKAPSGFRPKLLAMYSLCVLSGALAFLSKQNAASLPGAILLVEYILFDRTWKSWKRKLIWFLPVFLVTGLVILSVSGFLRDGFDFGRLLEDVSVLSRETVQVTRWEYLCTQFNVIVIYIRMLFLPVGQNVDHMVPFKEGFFDGLTPLAFLFLLALIVIGLLNTKKRPVITFGIFWFFITLSVESSIVPISDAMFEHRLYLPMPGFAIVAAYLVWRLFPLKRFWPAALCIFIVMSLGTATFLRNRVWQNAVALWSDAVTKNPKNYRAHINLGYAFRQRGRLDDAVSHYREAIRIVPHFAPAHNNLGVAFAQQGKLKEAFFHFSEGLRLRPGDPEILTNYGQACMQDGKIEEAISCFKTALRARPANATARNNLGIALAQQGKLKEAAEHFMKALKSEPHNAKIHRNAGLVFMLQGDLKGASHHLSEAVRIEPGYAEAHCKLAAVLMRQGDMDGSIKHFSKALEIQPGMNEASQGLNQAIRLKELKKPPYR